MIIPSEFYLFGRKVNVVADPTLIANTGNVGEARYRYGTIVLQPDTEGYPRQASAVEQTYCHELVHWILEMMGESGIKETDEEKEKFVDTFASLLHQSIVTSTGKADA